MRLGPVVVLVLVAGGYAACHPWISDGPFEGRVVDFHTGRPIEGAAVAAVWSRHTAAIAQDIETAYAAQETVTDAEGRFRLDGIHGWNWIPLSSIQDAEFIILAPGYETCRRTGADASGGCGLPNVRLRSLLTLPEDERAHAQSAYPGQDFEGSLPNLMRTMRSIRDKETRGAIRRRFAS